MIPPKYAMSEAAKRVRGTVQSGPANDPSAVSENSMLFDIAQELALLTVKLR